MISDSNTSQYSVAELKDLVVKILDDNKAEDIVAIDLAGKSSIADFMVICSGRSSRQVSSLAENFSGIISKEGYQTRLNGKETGDWVIVDGGDFIVHVFRPEVREFYKLEKIWNTDFSSADHTLYISG